MTPYYQDNSELNIKTEIIFDGRREYRTHLKKIRGQFYVKDRDCFMVGGKWYRVDSGLIAFNHSTQQWFLKSQNKNIMNGIVDFKDGAPVTGYFDFNPYETVDVIYKGNQFHCINEKVALKFAKESPCRGLYIHSPEISITDKQIRNFHNNQNNTYNAEDNMELFTRQIDLYDNFEPDIPKSMIKYAQYLGDDTFGAEFEAIRGYLPTHLRNKYGVLICRDGSLKDEDGSQGPEYTTVPLSGAKGIYTLVNLAKELSKRNHIDHHCSFHLHMGNIKINRISFVTLYKLCYQIQDDLFKMFPYYKNNEVKYAGKNKNYCQKLSRLFPIGNFSPDKKHYQNFINDTYLRIYRFLLEGVTYPNRKFNRKNLRHPKADKWARHSRYHWVNFINLITSSRNTVEFRLHTATLNPQKIITWLFICNAIIKTAIHKSNTILRGEPITLMDVFDFYKTFYKSKAAGTISDYLREYYNQRVQYFERDFNRGDMLSRNEIAEDGDFNFYYSYISEIFK